MSSAVRTKTLAEGRIRLRAGWRPSRYIQGRVTSWLWCRTSREMLQLTSYGHVIEWDQSCLILRLTSCRSVPANIRVQIWLTGRPGRTEDAAQMLVLVHEPDREYLKGVIGECFFDSWLWSPGWIRNNRPTAARSPREDSTVHSPSTGQRGPSHITRKAGLHLLWRKQRRTNIELGIWPVHPPLGPLDADCR